MVYWIYLEMGFYLRALFVAGEYVYLNGVQFFFKKKYCQGVLWCNINQQIIR